MFKKYLALSAGAVAATNTTFPAITIKEDGQDKTLYVVGPSWYDAQGGAGMQIPHGGRSYLATTDALGPDNWYRVDLLGGAIEYDVDLSHSGCSCNAALYLILMPALDENGKPVPGDPKYTQDYYCDANMVGGNWCPEFDIMEANTWAWHTTPHKCDAPNDNGHYTNCDRGGSCFQVAYDKLKGIYGPGDQYEINTEKVFHAKIAWGTDASFTVTFSQDGHIHSMKSDEGCADYLRQVQHDIGAGMTMAISNWGTDFNTMSWLDQDTGCQGECTGSPMLQISNIAYTKGSGPAPPTPDPYEYGDPCKHSNDGDCGSPGTCPAARCDWSWPKDDPAKWNSKDAKCRCKPASEDEQIEVLI